MKKIAIPAILAATVLLAGFVAFAPVERANAVHTTILAATTAIAVDTFDASAVAVADTDEIEVTGTEDFCLQSLIVEFANLDADDDLGYDDIEVDDVAVTTVAGVAQTANIITNAGVATRSVDVVAIIGGETEVKDTTLCSDGGELDIELDDAPDGAGDLIAGEVTTITAVALVDNAGTITVTLAAAD